MLAKVTSAALVGLEAVPVEVEVDIASQGLPSFTIVGLPDKAVEEAKERVRSALKNSGADFPAKRITVNLAPADLPKEGPAYDLPIALGILLASGQLTSKPEKALVFGELSLDGKVRPIRGALPFALLARKKHYSSLFVPDANAPEAALVDGLSVYAVDSLKTLFLHVSGQKPLPAFPTTDLGSLLENSESLFDMADIRGQEQAKRVVEIAAAGGHNLLMKGPPGAGKTLLARTMASILPRLTFDEVLETTKIYSIAGALGERTIITTRPFRAPHHTTSLVGLIGGGSKPQPGEVTLAHRGVLFLDEFPEFPRQLLESLRQPLEDHIITISRSQKKVSYPANVTLVAAQNPCPCGFLGDDKRECRCSPSELLRYRRRLSGPILDRIDLHITVPAIPIEKLTSQTKSTSDTSQTVRERVENARKRQAERFKHTLLTTNADMTSKDVDKYSPLSTGCLSLLRQAVASMQLSGRAYYRIIKVAQTIADLAGQPHIEPSHIAEALQYRPKQDIL